MTACLHDLVGAQAAATPGRLAVICGEDQLTYAALHHRATALAAELRTAGTRPETPVAVAADRSVHALVAILAVLYAGGAYLPLDPTYPPERLRYTLADSGAIAITGTPQATTTLHQAAPGLPVITIPATDPATPITLEPAPVTPDNLAYLIYTSGSTGRPKGVAVTHRNIVASTTARWTYPDPGIDLLTLPLTFDAAGGGLYWMWTRGGTVALPTEEENRDPRLMARLVHRIPITHINSMHAHYGLILDTTAPADLSHLRYVDVGGEPLPPALVAEHHRRTPDALLCNCYGPTEATIWATTHTTSPADGQNRTVPIGTPIPNTTTYILDTHLNPVPPGTPGELYIGGPAITRGYHHQPALTAQRYLPDPYTTTPGGRLYRTGDRARQHPDGTIDYLGRTDHQIKIRGFRVELPEIENTLLQHPLITQAIVTHHPTPQGTPRLTAHIVTQGALAEASLREWLAERLPPFMRPTITMVPTLPRAANGKVDRARLADRDASGVPAPESIDQLTGEQLDRLLTALTEH
jgi:amino acid adenylation domain-containing protein